MPGRSSTRRTNPFSIWKIKKLKSEDDLQVIIEEHCDYLINLDYCYTASNRKQNTSCTCMHVFRNNENSLSDLHKMLAIFARYDLQERRLFLSGILSRGFLKHQELSLSRELSNKAPHFSLVSVLDNDGGCVNICRNAVRALFYIGEDQWQKLSSLLVPAKSTNSHHMKDNQNAASKQTQDVIDYLYEIGRDEGESYATRFIRFLTRIEIRDEEKGFVQLPSCYTKRQMYKNYCFGRGWIAKSDHKGNYSVISDYTRRRNDDELGDMASWPTGSVCQKVCSFSTFLNIWTSYLPYLSIRPPSLDTCMQCHVFRNQAKYQDTVLYHGIPNQNNATAPENETPNYNSTISSAGTTNNQITNRNIDTVAGSSSNRLEELIRNQDETEEFRENLVIAAAQHVHAAKAQKQLAAKKIQEAKLSHQRNENKVIT